MTSIILVLIVGIVSVAVVVGGIMYIVLDAIAHDKDYTPGPTED